MKNMISKFKIVKILIYQGINYGVWYIVYSLPILYQIDFGKFIESIDIDPKKHKEYIKHTHELLGMMPFKELMKQNPIYVLKNVYFGNRNKKLILWVNKTGYEYDQYSKNVLNTYYDTNGQLDEKKLYKNYKKIEMRYQNEIMDYFDKGTEMYGIYELKEDVKMVSYFTKSFYIYSNDEYCIIINRKFDEAQYLGGNGLFLIDSHFYNPKYRIDNCDIKPEKFYKTLNSPKPYTNENFVYACLENLDEAKHFFKEVLESTIMGKDYILESLSKVENEKLLEELCSKKFIFLESIQNRADYIHYIYGNYEEYEILTIEEVHKYREKINNENSNK